MNPVIHTWLSRAIVCIAVLSALVLAHNTHGVHVGNKPERIAGQPTLSQDRLLAQEQASAE